MHDTAPFFYGCVLHGYSPRHMEYDMFGFFLVAVAACSIIGLALTGEVVVEEVEEVVVVEINELHDYPKWQQMPLTARERKLARRKRRQRTNGRKNRR